MADLKEIADSLIKGKAPQVKELVKKALDEGVGVEKILNEALVAGMDVVGRSFRLMNSTFPRCSLLPGL